MKKFWFVIFILFLFIIDRSTKYLILKTPAEGILLFPEINFKLYLNQGIAFSLPLPNIISLFLTIIIILYLIYLLQKFIKNQQPQYFLPLSFLLIGSISNLFDRIRFGAIIDFISIYFLPAFNLADAYIVSGLVILIINLPSYYSVSATNAESSKTVTGDSAAKHDFSK